MKTYPIVLYVSKSRALIALQRKKYLRQTFAIGYKGLTYVVIVLLIFLLGVTPVIFNFVVDPYNMNKVFNLNLNKEKISLKAHYPLWKIANYPKDSTTTVILGDSRALALKDKYWQQLNVKGAYNFAYGGATVYEIIDTVDYLKSSPQLKTLFIGIQLRSFSPLFKKAMNRVPEAIELANNPIQYYSNGFITEISWRHIEKRYPVQANALKRMTDISPISSAHASDSFQADNTNLKHLLDPNLCRNCALPKVTQSAPAPTNTIFQPKVATNLGIWQSLWPTINLHRELPLVFSRQVSKNAKSDWQSFSFSNTYWQGIVDIAKWSKENDVKLIFFIPPTLAEMQQQITNYGYAKLNQQLREDLAQLAPVIDFDFDNNLTRDIRNFSDAYHFNYKVAKAIIGELVQIDNKDPYINSIAKKRRNQIQCPLQENEVEKQITTENLTMIQGKSCRVWRGYYE